MCYLLIRGQVWPEQAADWVEQYRQHWEESFDKLDVYLKTIQKATSASDRILLSLQEEAGDV